MLAKNGGGIYRRESYEEMLETVKDPYFFHFLVEGAYKDLFLFNFRVRVRCDTFVIIYICFRVCLSFVFAILVYESV